MNNEDGDYPLYNIRDPCPDPLYLDETALESGFDAVYPWVHVGENTRDKYFTHNNPICPNESREYHLKDDTGMTDPKSDGDVEAKHDSASTSPSHHHVTPTSARDNAITLTLYTTTHNTTDTRASTLIITVVNIPTHATERLSEVTTKYAKAMNNEEKFYMLRDPRQPYPRRSLDLNKTVSQA